MSAAAPLPWEDHPDNSFAAPADIAPPGGLHPSQQEVFDDLVRFNVIAAGRRFGKTFFSVKLACYWARLTHDGEGRSLRGSNVWYIAPTMDLATETVAPLMLDELGEACVKHHKVQNYFELENGCRIYLKSANRPENLRGRSLRGVVLDEISVMRPEVWDLIVRPMLVDKQAPALIIGTPVSRGKLFELHQRATNDKTGEWRAWTFKTTDNPLISKREVASASAAMPKAAFRQEFEADFATGGGMVFKSSQLKVGGMSRGVYQMAVVFGSDDAFASNALAVSGTESAIVVCCMHPQGWTVVKAQTGYWSVSETVKRIGKLWKRLNPRFLAISSKDYRACKGVLREYGRRTRIKPRPFEVFDGESTDRIKWALQDRLKLGRITSVKGRGMIAMRNQLQDFPLEFANSELVQALAYIDQLPQTVFNQRDRGGFRSLDFIAGY